MKSQEILYFLPQILSAGVSVWVGILAWRRRSVPGATPLAWIAFAEAEWSLAHIGQLISADLSAKLVWNNIQFIGAVLAPQACLGFALEYNSARPASFGLRWKSLSAVSLFVLGFIWTDGLHGLFRRFPRIIPSYPVNVLVFDPGPAFEVYSVYAYSLVIITSTLLIVMMINGSRLYRTQVCLMLAGILIPWLTSVITATGLVPVKLYQITPLTFGVSNVLIAWALFRYRLLEIIPVARASLIESISDGVVVLDITGMIVDSNPSACHILRLPGEGLLKKPIRSLISLPDDFFASDDMRLTKKCEITLNGPAAPETYDLELRQLRAGEKLPAGFLLVFHNITEQKKTEINIRRNMALLEAAIQSSTNGVIVIDSDLAVVLFNRRLSSILHLPERWDQMHDAEKMRELAYCYKQPGIFYEDIEELLKNPGEQRLTTFETVNGMIMDCSISPYQVGTEKSGWLLSYSDVTEQKIAEEGLRNLAITDSLTQVSTRRHFFSLAQKELDRSIRYNRDMAIILFDIDHFKLVNDTFGHLVGDQVLEALAADCKNNLRSFDVIGRYGGEEFIILLPETNVRRAAQIAERLRKQALEIKIQTAAGSPTITISLGIAGIPAGRSVTLDELIGTADQALYRAKKEGRNQTCVLIVGESVSVE